MSQFTRQMPLAASQTRQECVVCLGRYGDIINALPIAKDIFDTTGVKPAFCAGRAFASVLEGVSYVVPEVWDGEATQLKEAVAAMAGKYGMRYTRIAQVFGDDWVARTRSFCTDAWLRAGYQDKWDKLPLVFDNRSPEREQVLRDKLMFQGVGTVILALEGRNSPLPNASRIADAIKKRLVAKAPKLWILELVDQVKAERIYDLLGLMDESTALICADSAVMHLAAASKIRTVALVSDLKGHWLGTKPRCNAVGKLSYSEVGKDVDGSVDKIVAWVLGEQPKAGAPAAGTVYGWETQCKARGWPCGYFRLPTEGGLKWFNPGLCQWSGQLYLAARRNQKPPPLAARPGGMSSIGLFWVDPRTKAITGDAINKINERYPQVDYEDPRLCVLNGRLNISYVRFDGKVAKQCLAEPNGYQHWLIDNIGNNGYKHEKNWVWFQSAAGVACVYRAWPHEVYLVRAGKFHETPASQEEPWDYGLIRGGSPPVLVEDLYWCFTHSATDIRGPKVRYYMGAYCFEPEPPFAIKGYAREPLLMGSEMDGGDKPVVYPGGAVYENGKWLVALGVNDHMAGWCEIPHGDVAAACLPVGPVRKGKRK